MEPVTAGLSAGKALLSLGGPVARWRASRGATKMVSDIENLLDPSSATVSAILLDLQRELRDEHSLPQGEIVSVMRAARSPLVGEHVRMIVVNSVAGTMDDKGRGRILSALTAALRVEGVQVANAKLVASLLELRVHAATKKSFTALSKHSFQRARALQASAERERRRLSIFSDDSMHKRTEHISRITTIDHDLLSRKLIDYSTGLIGVFETLSVPTPSREFQVPFEEVFQNSHLAFHDVESGGGSDIGGALHLSASVGDDEDLPGPELLRVVAEQGSTLLFGNPGSGKSTHSQAAILALAKSLRDGLGDAVPFRIDLRNYARKTTPDHGVPILDYMLESVGVEYGVQWSANEVRYLLTAGRVVVFFDGLDEVLDVALRRLVVRRIGSFSSSFPGSDIVIASRLAGYDEAPVPLSVGLRAVRTDALTTAEVENFATWFFNKHELGQYRREQGVLGFMEQTEVVADIRSNPLMLGVLCGLFAAGRSVPSNRTELYRDCSRMLFEQWDQLKGTYVTLLDHDVAERAIRELSNDLLVNGREALTIDELEEFLSTVYERESFTAHEANRRALATIESWRGRRWILVFDGTREGCDWYRFAHRTFLEFFAAEHLAFDATDGAEVFARLEPFIVARSPLPYIHLSVELASRRRAREGDSIVEAFMAAINQPGRNVVEVLACCITLAEVLPGLRLSNNGIRVGSLIGLFSWLSAVLPKTTSIERFYSNPYAYADFRALDSSESSLADGLFRGEELDSGSTMFEDSGIDYLSASRIVLGLDHGTVDAPPITAAARLALDEVRKRVDSAVWHRLILFLSACPAMESAETYSRTWRGQLATLADEFLTELAIAFGEDVLALLSDLDESDRWTLILLAQRPEFVVPSLLGKLASDEMFIGGTPFPVVMGSRNYPTCAHAAIYALASSPTMEYSRSLLNAVKLDNDWAGRSQLFASWRGDVDWVLAPLDVRTAFKCAALLLRIASLGDESFVTMVRNNLDHSRKGHHLLHNLLLAMDYDESPLWPSIIASEELIPVPEDELRELLQWVTSDPGLVLTLGRRSDS